MPFPTLCVSLTFSFITICCTSALAQSPVPPVHHLYFASQSTVYAADKNGLWWSDNFARNWKLVLKTPDSSVAWHGVSCISLPNQNAGFVVADQKLFFTGNGSDFQLISVLPAAVTSCFFLDAQHGWIASSEWPEKMPQQSIPSLSRTEDGGRTWKKQWSWQKQPIEKALLRAMYFSDRMHGWAAGDQIIVRTEDGGTTWTPSLFSDAEFVDIRFSNQRLGWATTVSSSQYFVTANGGKTWNAAPGPPAADDSSANVVRSSDGRWFAAAKDLFQSADGRHWKRVQSDETSDWQWVRVFQDDIVIAAGEKYLPSPTLTFATSNDGGRTWRSSLTQVTDRQKERNSTH